MRCWGKQGISRMHKQVGCIKRAVKAEYEMQAVYLMGKRVSGNALCQGQHNYLCMLFDFVQSDLLELTLAKEKIKHIISTVPATHSFYVRLFNNHLTGLNATKMASKIRNFLIFLLLHDSQHLLLFQHNVRFVCCAAAPQRCTAHNVFLRTLNDEQSQPIYIFYFH